MQDVLGFAQGMLHMALSNALFAGVAALLVWGFSRLCRKPALIHALWLVVLLKLLTPPIWNLPIHLAIHDKPHVQPVTVAIETKPIAGPSFDLRKTESVRIDEPVPPMLDEVPKGIESSARDLELLFEQKPEPDARIAPQSPMTVVSSIPVPLRKIWTWNITWNINWTRLLPAGAALWAMGTALCLLLAALRIARFHRILRFSTRADWELQEEADRLARRMGMHSSPRIWLVSGAVCPMLWAAWGRPRVLVPRELWGRFDAQQRRTLLVHELAHCVRRDHWVRYLELLVTAIYWWNPLCWWARRHLREAEEQCCDAWVMALMPGSFKQYAHALLEAVDWISAPRGGGSRPYSVPALASGMGQFTDLKRRLTMLKQGNVSQSVGFGGAAATLALAASLLPVMPTFAQTAAPPAAAAPQPQFIYVTAPEQEQPASALPGTMPEQMVVTSSAAGPAIVSVTPATTTPPAYSSASIEYRQAAEVSAPNQAWVKFQDGRQIELAKAQAEVAALQAQLNAATARLQKLQMDAFKADVRANFNNNPNGLVLRSDGQGGVIVLTPDKKMVVQGPWKFTMPAPGTAPMALPGGNPFQAQGQQPGQPMQPMPRFGGGGMQAMPGGGMGKFGSFDGKRFQQFKADAGREERMNKIESQLSELMKSVAELRQEVQHQGGPASADQAPRE